nr:putative GH32 family protein [Hypsibius dujardini]
MHSATKIGFVGLLVLLLNASASISSAQDNSWKYTQKFRPQFHFSPAEGWIGDPDGMIRFDNLYHVFWWGHAVSDDLVHWKELAYPMKGDNGSFLYFSGSVVVDKQNSSGFGTGEKPPMIAIYTMHDQYTKDETQGLSISQDYKTFTYYDKNPVLDAEQAAFRDPTVFFHEPSKRWIMVITLPEERKVSFYASADLKQWTHLSDFGPMGATSQVWEVPDLVEMPLDGDAKHTKWVLFCGMGPNRVQYFVGDFDGTRFTPDPATTTGQQVHWLDYGPDYYAARTYRDYDGVEQRTVMMAWMGNWEYADKVPTTWGKGTLALPRELTLKTSPEGVRIVQKPIPALEMLRQDEVQTKQMRLEGTMQLTAFAPRRNTYELDASFTISDPAARFGLRLATNGNAGIAVGYDAKTGELFIDRMHPENGDFNPNFPKLVTAPLLPNEGTIRLHIYVDQSSVEVFANEGEVTMTALYFPDPASTGIEAFSDGGQTTLTQLSAWELESIWGVKPK